MFIDYIKKEWQGLNCCRTLNTMAVKHSSKNTDLQAKLSELPQELVIRAIDKSKEIADTACVFLNSPLWDALI